MKLSEILLVAKNRLQESKIDSYNIDSRVLLQFLLSISHEELVMYPDRVLDNNEQKLYFDLIKRRCMHEPVAYITSSKEFFDLQFFVDKSVLIPRPETEILVESVLTNINKPHGKFLELGSGSGCISIALLNHYKDHSALCVDISDQALSVTRRNAKINNVKDRLSTAKSDWFSSLKEEKFDFIVSNPPYISFVNERSMMAKETVIHEPKEALYADQNGYDSYLKIAKNAGKYLTSEGKIFLEIGVNQEELVISIFKEQGFIFHSQYKDLSEIVRCLVFSK